MSCRDIISSFQSIFVILKYLTVRILQLISINNHNAILAVIAPVVIRLIYLIAGGTLSVQQLKNEDDLINDACHGVKVLVVVNN